MSAKSLTEEILVHFPGSRSLRDAVDLADLWSLLPRLDADGVKRLLPCLMLTVLCGSEDQSISLTFADQLIYYLDGNEFGVEKDAIMDKRRRQILRSFSSEQGAVIERWLLFVGGMKFADCAQKELASALEYWRQMRSVIGYEN